MRSNESLPCGDALRAMLRVPRQAVLEAIVARLGGGQHARPREGQLTRKGGLVGDRWAASRPSHKRQLTLMDARVVRLLLAHAGAPLDQLDLPGDNLVIDLPTGIADLPPRTRIRIGSALIEILDTPHLGCAKFEARFGPRALAWVNDDSQIDLRLRGIYANVIEDGIVAIGDRITIVHLMPGG